LLVTAHEQDDSRIAAVCEVDTVTGTKVQAKFE
jgi:hypothetical protein